MLSPDFVQECNEKIPLICQWLLTVQSHQKSYVDRRRHPLEFVVGDWIFLKVSLTWGVVRIGKRGKLSPKFIGPLEII